MEVNPLHTKQLLDEVTVHHTDNRTGWMDVPTTKLVYAGFSMAALAGLLFGFDIGATSVSMASSTSNSTATATGAFGLSDSQRSLGTSSSLIGATLGCLTVTFVGDSFGRRREIILAATLYAVASILSAFVPTTAFGMLVAARTLYGYGVGFAMHAAPTYIAEIAPPSMRGTLVAMKEAIIVVGMMLGYLVGYIFKDTPDGWRYVFGVAAVPAGLLLLAFLLLPPSPRWLLLKAQSNETYSLERATAALRRFRAASSEAQVEEEMAKIAHELEDAAQVARGADTAGDSALRELLRHPRAVAAGFGLVFLQQVTGQPSVLYYATTILKDAGFGDDATLAATIVATVKLLATLASVLNVDKLGRRPMLFVGISLMTAALVAMSVLFWVSPMDSNGDYTFNGATNYLVVLALMVYVSGYQVGFGPIAWLMVSEVFPLHVRGSAIGAAVVVNFASNLLMTYSYLSMKDLLTTQGNFLLYAVIAAVSLLYVYFLVPETKGKSLEQIQQMLQARTGHDLAAEEDTPATADAAALSGDQV